MNAVATYAPQARKDRPRQHQSDLVPNAGLQSSLLIAPAPRPTTRFSSPLSISQTVSQQQQQHSPPAAATLPATDNGTGASSVGSKICAKRDAAERKTTPVHAPMAKLLAGKASGACLTDTPVGTAPNSPNSRPLARTPQQSAASTPRIRPTTLDIPGLTKSRVSPDGRIAQSDIGSKLVIVMVGLPARGKSYITKKIARYLNWLQHDTRIFNVGERRRVAARCNRPTLALHRPTGDAEDTSRGPPDDGSARKAAMILINGELSEEPLPLPPLALPAAMQPHTATSDSEHDGDDVVDDDEAIEHTAHFFDPQNKKASCIREQVAMETLDELLDYILVQGGSVGIFDATNSTLERRKSIMDRIRERAGEELNVLFIESLCTDQALLESNILLKLSGPDYRDQDPITALDDFRQRIAIYEKNYVPIGEYEEGKNLPYVQMIDVGRKLVSHQIRGFLSAQTVYYLLNFNLAPRQIWITRHGESEDNVGGRIGGDSELSERGRQYARALASFVDQQRKQWHVKQLDKAAHTHFPPHPGDHTPPNPHYCPYTSSPSHLSRSFCVWTSMLRRSVDTAAAFNEDEYDVKEMRMLNELYAGSMEGMTYDQIKREHRDHYEMRLHDKLQYRYPGPGGEGYLDVINRLRPVIVELERMTDHVLLIGHRSVARVLLAYFKGLRRDEVADLDVPLGMLYSLEPVSC